MKIREILSEALITIGGKAFPKFGQAVILAGGAGCHAKGEKILKHDMTTVNAEDVKVGDILMGDDGTPREVMKLHRGPRSNAKTRYSWETPRCFQSWAYFQCET